MENLKTACPSLCCELWAHTCKYSLLSLIIASRSSFCRGGSELTFAVFAAVSPFALCSGSSCFLYMSTYAVSLGKRFVMFCTSWKEEDVTLLSLNSNQSFASWPLSACWGAMERAEQLEGLDWAWPFCTSSLKRNWLAECWVPSAPSMLRPYE